MDRLPPLNAVRAFEAAARHCSVTEAANELHVTPGAVSRQVHALEEFLGMALFERGHRQIKLTRRGDEYYKVVAKLLELLHDATRRVKKGAQKKQLRIRAYTTFAMRWLIPRLSELSCGTSEDRSAADRVAAAGGFCARRPRRCDSARAGRLAGRQCLPSRAEHPRARVQSRHSAFRSTAQAARRSCARTRYCIRSRGPDDWDHWSKATGPTATSIRTRG